MRSSTVKLGVYVDHLRLGPRQGLARAAGMGFRAVQLNATVGPVLPKDLSHSGRRELRRLIAALGLELTALDADVGGTRFADPAALQERIDASKQIIELAAELHVPVVTTAVGTLSDSPAAPRRLVTQALAELGDHADRTGTFLAVETADADPRSIAALLTELDCPALKVSYDPASVILAGCDPLAGVEPVADQIVAAQLRDAVRPSPTGAREVPLGQGDLHVVEYLALLAEAGYHAYHILQRRGGHDPAADLLAAKQMIERL